MNRILLLSNDPVLIKKNIDVLSESGFHVEEVPEALDGLLMVDKNNIDAVIIDEELSDIDGYRASQKLRQFSQMPIIILGSQPSDEVWTKVDEIGFDAYLKKPVNPRELAAQLKALIRRSHAAEVTKVTKEDKPSEIKSIPVTSSQSRLAKPVQTEEPPKSIQRERPPTVQAVPVASVPMEAVPPEPYVEPQAATSDNGSADKVITPQSGEPEQPRPYVELPKSVKEEKPEEEQPPTGIPEEVPIEKEPPVSVVPVQATSTVTVHEGGNMGKVEVEKKDTVAKVEHENGFQVWKDARIARLLDAMISGRITEISPSIDFAIQGGVTYPEVDGLIDTTGEETIKILEVLVERGILEKKKVDKLRSDPEGSFQLVPVERCPIHDSSNLLKGQLIEHFNCGYVGLEQDFQHGYQLICPKCKRELKLVGTDYRNAGIQYRCLDGNETFATPVIKWRSLRTGRVWTDDELREVEISSYSLIPGKREWVEFQLKPKAQLVDFLRNQGYQVQELAQVQGTSGAIHTIDILATRDDKIAKFHVGIGILTAPAGEQEIGLDELFKFDTEAYDIGINYKVVIAIPKLSGEALKFAERQKIGAFEAKDMEQLISYISSRSRSATAAQTPVSAKPLGSGAKSSIVEFLQQRGYEVFERAKVAGKSGADHIFDIFARRDDVIVKPTIAVVMAENGHATGIEKIAQFDAEAFDAGIRNKAVIGVPRVGPQARQFAKQQRITVLDENEILSLYAT